MQDTTKTEYPLSSWLLSLEDRQLAKELASKINIFFIIFASNIVEAMERGLYDHIPDREKYIEMARNGWMIHKPIQEAYNQPHLRCVRCGKEYSDYDYYTIPIQGKCPNCGTKSLPMDIEEDVTVKINWHELRILTIWAENYARQLDGKEENKNSEEAHLTGILIIAERLQRQHPNLTKLTLFGEIREMKQSLESNGIRANVISDLDNDEKLKL